METLRCEAAGVLKGEPFGRRLAGGCFGFRGASPMGFGGIQPVEQLSSFAVPFGFCGASLMGLVLDDQSADLELRGASPMGFGGGRPVEQLSSFAVPFEFRGASLKGLVLDDE